jgi:hypothetical protein
MSDVFRLANPFKVFGAVVQPVAVDVVTLP